MVKRERTSDSEEDFRPERKPKIEPEDKPKPSKSKAWTGAERQLLLKLVLEKGQKAAFENFPGRTKNQCSTTWRLTVLPMCMKLLGESAK